ncbi:SDR family NAD(P)-dependent oxidoreductase [Shivajiella indica]|uniref:SDR family NAD(P)-dependent oxidoreductase n=1 Tax=Shivajiella indica TaxID=872115 RepID=A0ABW5B999_9BACT
MNKVALITGASDGLGKAMAISCAKKEMDLLLVALPETGLPELAEFIEGSFEVRTHYLELDLTEMENCQFLINYVIEKELPVSFLINNAGIGGSVGFVEENFALFDKMILLNVRALTFITHGLIPILEKQEKSYILNVSSMIIHFEGPFKQVYGATKSYIYFFSKCLDYELVGKNIQVSILCPAGVNSNIKMRLLHNNCSSFQKLTILSPEEVADYALEKCLAGKREIIPGKFIRFLFFISKLMPNSLRRYLTLINNKNLIKSNKIIKEPEPAMESNVEVL